MTNNMLAPTAEPTKIWKMPILPEHYDRSPLTQEEWEALAYCNNYITANPDTQNRAKYVLAKQKLVRFNLPVADVYYLRHLEHQNPTPSQANPCADAQLFMRCEMYRRRKMFWDWSLDEWVDTLCQTPQMFEYIYRRRYGFRATIMDIAYLLGGVTDLRSFGGISTTAGASAYFGDDLISQQCRRLIDALIEKGYNDGIGVGKQLRRCLSTLFILNRSPYLEDISEELLAAQITKERQPNLRGVYKRILNALQHLGILPTGPRNEPMITLQVDASGMAPEWFGWCMAWYERDVALSPLVRRQYAYIFLEVGRWLQDWAPEVRTPEQWTEDLALRFRSDVCSWTVGQYGSGRGREALKKKYGPALGQPIKAGSILRHLVALNRYFTDLSKHPYAIAGEPPHKIRLDFNPKEVFACPDSLKKEMENVEPRDINLRIWARLVIAAATLSQSDLPQSTKYPLSFYRAMALVWVSTARRPNEIARLRLECVRDDWVPDMLDEDDLPLEPPTRTDKAVKQVPVAKESDTSRIYYLHIPSGKYRGPFWVWIPDYVASAIDTWKRERPRKLPAIFDRKDREYVDYLFCYKDHRVGAKFINNSLIPTLCKKAGVDLKDTIGRITGHRARSTRLTLLRLKGVSLEDLAEYAGHADTKTLKKHYVRHHPHQFHRIIRDADDVSRIIEGVIDVQAAARGLPALRWFIGYDADGEPQYCANQVYHTCPHRLDCIRCGMFIGGEKAKLLHEGEQTLPITSKVPMTPVEKCLVEGDEKGMGACQAALKQVPAPKAPDINLIFNPEGLSNQELEQLAQVATVDALDKLRLALDAHKKRLEDIQQHKTGRSALVGAQKKRISLIQQLIIEGEQRGRQLPGDSSVQTK